MVDASSVYLPGAVLAILSVVLLVLYLWYRMRQKRGRTLAESEERRYSEDRAHNQVQLTSAAADRLARDGVDVTRVRELLAQAESRIERRDFDQALGLARAAQQHLSRLRETSRGPTLPVSDQGRPEGPVLASAEPLPPTRYTAAAARAAEPENPQDDDPLPPAAPTTRLPKNRMEAQFMLRLLGEEVDRARAEKPPRAELAEAEELRRQADAAFQSSDFTEALRVAIKGRRRLGVRIETLPVTTPASLTPPAPAPAGASPSAPGACPRCGRVNSAADRFCGSCGAELRPASCPRCGKPVPPENRFCAFCGAPIA